MSFCRTCGAALSQGASFCTHCGAAAAPVTMNDAVAAPGAVGSAPALPAGSAALSPEGERLLKLGIGVVIAAAAIRVLGALMSIMISTLAGVFAFTTMLPGVLLAGITLLGVARRKRWGRICAIVFGIVRLLATIGSFVTPWLGFGIGGRGVALGMVLGVLELAILAVGAYVFLRPEAKEIWSGH